MHTLSLSSEPTFVEPSRAVLVPGMPGSMGTAPMMPGMPGMGMGMPGMGGMGGMPGAGSASKTKSLTLEQNEPFNDFNERFKKL